MIPTLLWHQTPKHVHFLIDLKNASNERIGMTEQKFTFSGKSTGKDYEITFELANDILPEESAYTVTENNIKIILTKKEAQEWQYLQKDKNLFKNNIKVNWDLWNEEDDDEDLSQNNNGAFDMSQMMGGMGDYPDFSQYDNTFDYDKLDAQAGMQPESNCCFRSCCSESNFCESEECSNDQSEKCCGKIDCCSKESKCSSDIGCSTNSCCLKESNCPESDCKQCSG